MQIAPGLHLVDGMGQVVNAYVWQRPDGGLTLIDAGMPSDAPKILAFVGKLGAGRLDRIIATHGDIDHIGGLAAIQAATGARVICHAVEKAVVEGRQRRHMGDSLLARAYGPTFDWAMRTFLRYRPVDQVDELVLDKQMLVEGLQVVHVPGHTPGQIALFEPRLSLPPAIATPRMDVAKDSIHKLAALKGVQVVCFGHGLPITQSAAERLAAFASSLDSPSTT